MKPQRRLRDGSTRPGFTMIEAMMTVLIMVIAILGMGALAAASVRSTRDAQDATRAFLLADRFVNMARTEAGGWNEVQWNPAMDVPDPAVHMPLLRRMTKAAGANGIGWAEATKQLPSGGPMAFDYNLRPVAPASAAAHFCVHYNLTWLQLEETMRADVRVYWIRRRGDNPHGIRNDCGAAVANTAALIGDAQTVSSVSRSVVLARTDERVR